MDIEKAKELKGRMARSGQLQGEVTDVRQLEDGMILIYFAGTVMNVQVLRFLNPETNAWEIFD